MATILSLTPRPNDPVTWPKLPKKLSYSNAPPLGQRVRMGGRGGLPVPLPARSGKASAAYEAMRHVRVDV